MNAYGMKPRCSSFHDEKRAPVTSPTSRSPGFSVLQARKLLCRKTTLQSLKSSHSRIFQPPKIDRPGGWLAQEEIEATKSTMGFFVISLYFVLMGLVGTLGIKVCYNKGPSTNMLNVVLVNTAVICCWLMWAIVWLAQWKPLINPILKAEGE